MESTAVTPDGGDGGDGGGDDGGDERDFDGYCNDDDIENNHLRLCTPVGPTA
jgi:hypothetical protein